VANNTFQLTTPIEFMLSASPIIYTQDGVKYLTKQTKIDIFFVFMREHGLSTQGFGTE
jgi:hypothetical protein